VLTSADRQRDIGGRPGDALGMSTSVEHEPVPRRVKAAAAAVPLCVLPSAAWRLAQVIGESPCITGGIAESVYVSGLSFVSMGAALLTLGLVARWGEVVPGWIPLAGGRPVPARAATIAAFAGATLIGLICAYAVLNQIFGFVEGPVEPAPPGCEPPGSEVALLYAPLLAWAPLLCFVASDHHRRSKRRRASTLSA